MLLLLNGTKKTRRGSWAVDRAMQLPRWWQEVVIIMVIVLIFWQESWQVFTWLSGDECNRGCSWRGSWVLTPDGWRCCLSFTSIKIAIVWFRCIPLQLVCWFNWPGKWSWWDRSSICFLSAFQRRLPQRSIPIHIWMEPVWYSSSVSIIRRNQSFTATPSTFPYPGPSHSFWANLRCFYLFDLKKTDTGVGAGCNRQICWNCPTRTKITVAGMESSVFCIRILQCRWASW